MGVRGEYESHDSCRVICARATIDHFRNELGANMRLRSFPWSCGWRWFLFGNDGRTLKTILRLKRETTREKLGLLRIAKGQGTKIMNEIDEINQIKNN